MVWIDPSSEEGVGVTLQRPSGRKVWIEFYNDGDILHTYLDDGTVEVRPGEPCAACFGKSERCSVCEGKFMTLTENSV